MKLKITKEWFERQAALEADLEIGAGVESRRPMTAVIAVATRRKKTRSSFACARNSRI
ncbi:hypothetical protein G6K88_07650 [Agrobacterium rhizogenes]|uniref:hypothetical protein n=1 Tax=Rhizobium rhizogenes TaxID=359 RepID=UPI001572A1F0|nr:hypothetical protein [Rhizobium rhizogenes]NTF80833.1 hypothetical protein [Rhizobium rhizogenes]NTI01892.1 hypothetical protein [Rhizobium rhizogenes]NTI08695.1 hypothetical protein [Rhizobium rhizogenes]